MIIGRDRDPVHKPEYDQPKDPLNDFDAILSIECSDKMQSPPIYGFNTYPYRKRLLFDDYRDVDYRAWAKAERNCGPDTGPTKEIVQEIISYAEALGHGKSVLVHCMAGISRSTAAALIMYRVIRGPGSEEMNMKEIANQRPVYRPNDRMCRFADEILGSEIQRYWISNMGSDSNIYGSGY